MKTLISKFYNGIINSIVTMSNLLTIISAFALAMFLLWIPLDGKEMFHKNLFWNIWFGVYFLFIFIKINIQLMNQTYHQRVLLGGIYFAACCSLTIIWCGIAGIAEFGKAFFFIALPLYLIGRFILYKYCKSYPNKDM